MMNTTPVPAVSLLLRPGRILAGVAILALLVFAAACGHKPELLSINPRFSWNVARPPKLFPDPELKQKLPKVQTDVLAQRGKPDFIRIWWRPDGSLIRSSDLSGRHDEMNQLIADARQSWIYLDDKEEVVFDRNGTSYKTQPLSEIMQLICNYGDPSSRSPEVLRDDGTMHETWTWIEYGLQVELADGHEINRSHFKATGAGTYLGK